MMPAAFAPTTPKGSRDGWRAEHGASRAARAASERSPAGGGLQDTCAGGGFGFGNGAGGAAAWRAAGGLRRQVGQPTYTSLRRAVAEYQVVRAGQPAVFLVNEENG